MTATTMKSISLFFGILPLFLWSILVFSVIPARSEERIVEVPNYFEPQERLAIADVSQIKRLRFLTSVDFPPFGFLDQTGRLTGFHVDLARALCENLKILQRCQIQALEWSELEKALQENNGEAIIAGLGVSKETRGKFLFTRSYLELPAKFVVLSDSKITAISAEKNEAVTIGVLENTAHQLMLSSWFPHLKLKPYPTYEKLFSDVRSKKIDGIFGDGLQLSFSLNSRSAEDCCRFLKGAYISQDLLGEGLAIAVGSDDQNLVRTLNYGLSQLSKNGRFYELYLRYFPTSIY